MWKIHIGWGLIEEPRVELRLLGAVELWSDGRRQPIGSPRQRSILALLALNVPRSIPIDALIARLWEADPPARATIHTYIARLRTCLEPATDAFRIDLRDHGYALQADSDLIDVHRFRRLRDQAKALADSEQIEEAAALMREAAMLWTDTPLGDLRGAWAERTRVGLREERLGATVQRISLELRLGHHADLVGELTQLVDDHPFHQELIGALMRALHGSGRSARALDVYREQRRRFVDEQGSEPGRGLRDLQQRIIAGDPGPAPGGGGPAVRRPPNNLPRDLPEFTGRKAETAELVDMCSPPPRGPAAVVAIEGTGGAGKSALAVHLAHRLAPSYPDAQLHLELGAYGPEGPLAPDAALARLLRMVGVPDNEVPATLAERTDLWRARMADRRAVLVLDDATGHDQVADLVPGSSRSVVIITSRHRLGAHDGVRAFPLGLMSDDDAARLLRAVTADGQADDEDATATVVRRCDGLPLALRIAGSRLRARPARTMRDLARQLRGAAHILGELRSGDRSVRVAFELSYRALPVAHRRAFRLFALHTGEEFTLHAAAALLGRTFAAAVQAVDDLLDHYMLEERSPGSYRFHDLIRSFARERAEAEDDPAERTAAQDRLGEYFLAVAERADRLLRPYLGRRRLGIRPVSLSRPPIADADEARQRMELEISGMIGHARRRYERLPELAHAIASYLDDTARWEAAIHIHLAAMRGWRLAADPLGEAAAMVDLVPVEIRCGRMAEAADAAQVALETYRSVGDRPGQAAALDRLGLAHWHMSEFDQALEDFDAAVTIGRDVGNEKWQAAALAHSGMALLRIGRYDSAILVFERALGICRRIGDQRGEMETLSNLGETQMHLGRHQDALRNFLAVTALTDAARSPQSEAIVQHNLGNCRLGMADTDAAFTCYRDALRIYREIGDQAGVAGALNGIGAAYRSAGRFSAALAHHESALRIAREASEQSEECGALRNIGIIYANTGKYRLAVDHLTASLQTARQVSDPYDVALTLTELGNALHRAHRPAEARGHWAESADIMRSLGLNDSAGTASAAGI